MAERRPLTVLLSQALIAFTIELDNEWEQRVPTATTNFGGRGVWGTSLRQWSNFMQYVPEDGGRPSGASGRGRCSKAS
jgi:hypothetical protein